MVLGSYAGCGNGFEGKMRESKRERESGRGMGCVLVVLVHSLASSDAEGGVNNKNTVCVDYIKLYFKLRIRCTHLIIASQTVY